MNTFLHMLLESSLTMTLLTLLLALLSKRLAGRYSARSVYLAWQVLLLGFLIPWRPDPAQSALTVKLPAMTEYIREQAVRAASAPGSSTAQLGLSVLTDLPQTAAPAAQQAAAWSLSVTEVLFFVWLCGALLFLGFQAARHLHFRRLVRRWSRPMNDEKWRSLLQTEKAKLDIKRRVTLLACPVVISPMLTGVFHPTILVPDADMAPEQAALVLRHELVHLRRHDLTVKLLTLLGWAIHWFNPALVLLEKSASFWCEAACDAEVVAGCGLEERETYTAAILSAIRRAGHENTRLAADFYGGVKGLKARITAIFDMEYKHIGVVLVTLAAILTVSTGAAFALSSVSKPAQQSGAAWAESYVGREVCTGPASGLLSTVTFGPTDPDWPQALCFPGLTMTVTEVRRTEGVFTSRGFPDISDERGTWWANISFGGSAGVRGWMPLNDLTDPGAAEDYGTAVLTAQAELHGAYDLSDAAQAILAPDMELSVLAVLRDVCYVRAANKTGFVDKTLLGMGAETEQRIAQQPFVNWDDILPGEDEKLAEYQAQVQQWFDEKGDSNLWSLADRAAYSVLTEQYGYEQVNYNILPGEDSLTEEEATAFAWAEAERSFGADYGASHRADYMPVCKYFYRTEDPTVKLWQVNLWPKKRADRRAAITFTDDLAVTNVFREDDYYGDQPGYDYETMNVLLGDPATWSEEDQAAVFGVAGSAAGGDWSQPVYEANAQFAEGDVNSAVARQMAWEAMQKECGLTDMDMAALRIDGLTFRRFTLTDEPNYGFFGRGWLVSLVREDYFGTGWSIGTSYDVVISSPAGAVVYQNSRAEWEQALETTRLTIADDLAMVAREAEIGPMWRWSLEEQADFHAAHPHARIGGGECRTLRSTDLSLAELTFIARNAVRQAAEAALMTDPELTGKVPSYGCQTSSDSPSGLILYVTFHDSETGAIRWQVNLDPADGTVLLVDDATTGNG